ncbi:hypothetical protein [Agrococcus terreus]|uniref:Uncharacterized protein n=1 Tax=Agrococcus terreus TaxID=574649 RepID=A0ABQ2KPS4_9MICO|nr:hypothetical protein [Agrococcus terreus]GGN89369.1 hypothetical protein GCM10010968_25950 [Agrococcus terreus]
MSARRAIGPVARTALVAAIALGLAACTPGALDVRTSEAPSTTARATSTPEPSPTIPEQTATSEPPTTPAAQTAPPVIPAPAPAPDNPYQGEPEWRVDEPLVGSSLAGPTVDVTFACRELHWVVRVDGVEYPCAVGSGFDTSFDWEQPPVILVPGVPIEPGVAPRIEQQWYASWDPELSWGTAVVTDPGAVPTEAALGRAIEGPTMVELHCRRTGTIEFAGGLVGCGRGEGEQRLGPLPDRGSLAFPPPVAPAGISPGYAVFYAPGQ